MFGCQKLGGESMRKIWQIMFIAIPVMWALAAYCQGPGRTQAPQMRQGPPPRMMGMGGGIPSVYMIESMSSQLGLSQTQQSKIRSIKTSSDKTIQPLMKKVQSTSEALRKAALAAKYNESEVKKLATNLRNAEAAVMNANIATWTKVRAVLTSDQVTKLRNIMDQGMRRVAGQGKTGMPISGGPTFK